MIEKPLSRGCGVSSGSNTAPCRNGGAGVGVEGVLVVMTEKGRRFSSGRLNRGGRHMYRRENVRETRVLVRLWQNIVFLFAQ